MRSAAARARRVCSVCTGAFLLAEAGLGLEIGAVAIQDVEGRIAAPDLGVHQQLVRDAGPLGRLDGGGEEIRILVIGRARAFTRNDQRPVMDEQRLAGVRFQLAPNLMRAVGELGVFGAFPAGEAGDARLAMARAHPMRWRELIDAEHTLSGFGELIERRRAHRAEADHDSVEARRHGISNRKREGWRL